MAINNITQTISTLPPAGRRGVDVQTQFVIKQEDFQDHLQGTTVDELNTLKDQLNSRIGEINSTTTTMNGYADTASAGASTATTKAGEASTSAGEALAYRNQAETFKNNASASATKASQWADNNYNVEVETGKYSAKHWTTVAQNTVNNKIDKVTSTDNAIVRFDGATGQVQNSAITIDDGGNIGTGAQSFNGFGGSGFKNYLYNPKFDVAQRGTVFDNNTTTGKQYTLDRWSTYFYNSNNTRFVTTTTGEVSNNAIKFGRLDNKTDTFPSYLIQELEIKDSVPLRGKPITLSFWAKKGSGLSSPLFVYLRTGVIGDESWTANYTGQADAIYQPQLTTTLTKYTFTTTIGTNIKQIGLIFKIDGHSASATVNDWVWIEKVQLEEGSVATPFENRPYGLELSLCQRYYEKVDSNRCNIPVYGTGTGFIGSVKYKVPKRTVPTISLGTASHWRTIVIYIGAALSTFNVQEVTAYGFEIEGTSSAGNIPAGYAGILQVGDGYQDNGTDGIFVSAEL